MRITTFRGEKSLLEITAKLFQDLAPELQERAAQALLLANPQLAFLTDVPVGAVILVPDVITARPKIDRGTEQQPAADIARVVSAALADYRRHLTQAAARGAEEADVTRKALKDKELSRVIAGDATLENLVAGIDKAALARGNEAKALRAFTTADLEVAEQDLAALLMDRLS